MPASPADCPARGPAGWLATAASGSHSTAVVGGTPVSEKSTREAHNKHILVQQSSICVAKKKSLAAGCLAEWLARVFIGVLEEGGGKG